MKNRYWIIGMILLSLSGCDTDDGEYMFTQERFIKYIYGKSGEDYSYHTFSFVYEEVDVTEKTLGFPIEFKGYNLTENLYYSVRVDKEHTFLPENCYRLDAKQVFRAGNGNVDTMYLTLLKKEILQDTSLLLRVKLVSDVNFQILNADSAFINIAVGNKMEKPDWWDYDITSAYLGDYSRKKYEEFHKETGIWDFGSLDGSEKRHYALTFKRALEREPRYEEDNKTLMSVTISG